MLDVPSSFSAFRRRLSSIGGATLPRVVEAPATWLAHEELPTSEGDTSYQEDTTAAVSIKRDKGGIETSRSRPRSMPDLLDDQQPITISDPSDEETEEHLPAKDRECDLANYDIISEVVTSEEETRNHLPVKDRECDLIDDDVINEVLTSEEVTKEHLPATDRKCHLVNDDVISDVFIKKVAENQDDNAAVTIGNGTKYSSATEHSSTESVNRFERMVHRSPTDNDLDRFSGYSREVIGYTLFYNFMKDLIFLMLLCYKKCIYILTLKLLIEGLQTNALQWVLHCYFLSLFLLFVLHLRLTYVSRSNSFCLG